MKYAIHAKGGALVYAGDDKQAAAIALAGEYAGAYIVGEGMTVTRVRPIAPYVCGYDWLRTKGH